MAKFIIACPVCGNYSEGKTGFFAKKKIQCACGNVIDVKADKMSVAECPHCANQIIYDQTKGVILRCPVCRQSFDTRVDQSRVPRAAMFTGEDCPRIVLAALLQSPRPMAVMPPEKT